MTTNQEITATDIGARIAIAMRDSGVKPTPLAAHIGVSESTLRRFIAGTHDPSYLQVVSMAEYLGKPIGWFVGENGASHD